MAYATEYRLSWTSVPTVDTTGEVIASQSMQLSIFDTDNTATTTTVISLQPSDSPVSIEVVDNDQDKFTPIRAKQLIATFESKSYLLQAADTFAESSDNRWLCEYTVDSVLLFTGFLMLSDVRQNFQPDPNKVVLTFSDHLGSLKDIPLTEDDGSAISGKYKLSTLLALAFKKTGLSLSIKAINNLRHGSGSQAFAVTFTASTKTITFTNTGFFFYPGQQITISGTVSNNGTYTVLTVTETTVITSESLTNEGSVSATFTDTSTELHFYDGVYLDSTTFEANTLKDSINCYDAIKIILGEDCFCTQWLGSWWIMRIDEFDDNPIYPATFNSDGVFQSFDSSTAFNKSIGGSEIIKFANADQILEFTRPHKYIKETFRYQIPAETICNIDYTRGDANADPDIALTGFSAFDLDDWTVGRLWGSGAATPTIKSSIQRSYNSLGDETERFIMLTYEPDSTKNNQYIKSCNIPVGYLDKFTFSFDAAAVDSPSGDGTTLLCMILLYGSDGSVYVLRSKDVSTNWDTSLGEIQTAWRLSNESVSLFRDGLQLAIYDDANHPPKTDWTTCIMVAAPVPVEGNVVIHLFSPNSSASTYDDFRIKFQNLSFDYRAYIGGTYKKYTGQHHKVTRNPAAGYNAIRETEVKMSDSPRPLFKGSMFFKAGSNYHLTAKFYTAAPYALGNPPSQDYTHLYGYIQAFSVWNQFRNACRIISGSVLGLGASPPDLLYKYTLTDTNNNTNNRYFILISYSKNEKTGLWDGVFIEVFRTDIGKIYTDDHEFKYLIE